MARLDVVAFCNGSHVTREDGARIYDEIEKHWLDPEPLVLDFAGVRVASVSFFDESLGRVAENRPLDELRARIRVDNIVDSDRALLNRVIQDRIKRRESRAVVATGAISPLLRAVGVPPDAVAAWDGKLLALYQDRSGHSHSLEVAQEIARSKRDRGEWTLDIGNYAMGLLREEGAKLKQELDALGFAYATRSLARDWARSRRNDVSAE